MKIVSLIRENLATNSNIIAFTAGVISAWLILVILKLDYVAIIGLLGVMIGSMLTLFSNYLIAEQQRKEKLELIEKLGVRLCLFDYWLTFHSLRFGTGPSTGLFD